MKATKPDIEVPGDNTFDLNFVPQYPIRVAARTMARSGECLGMNEHFAVWRFGYRHDSERAIQTSVHMPFSFLWVLSDRRSGDVKETWEGIAVELPSHFRRVIEWGD